MAQSAGVPGIAVALAGVGGLLLYAGLKGVSPLDALRSVASGQPPAPVEDKVPARTTPGDTTPSPSPGPGPSSTGAALLAAVQKYKGDRYSQIKRWKPGFSDCSSFVGKGLKDIGIKPPGLSLVSSYLPYVGGAWSGMSKITRAQLGPGDLIIARPGGHMVVAIDTKTAIGQQNPRRNVQTGPIESLMWGMMDTTSYWRVGATPPRTGGTP